MYNVTGSLQYKFEKTNAMFGLLLNKIFTCCEATMVLVLTTQYSHLKHLPKENT